MRHGNPRKSVDCWGLVNWLLHNLTTSFCIRDSVILCQSGIIFLTLTDRLKEESLLCLTDSGISVAGWLQRRTIGRRTWWCRGACFMVSGKSWGNEHWEQQSPTSSPVTAPSSWASTSSHDHQRRVEHCWVIVLLWSSRSFLIQSLDNQEEFVQEDFREQFFCLSGGWGLANLRLSVWLLGVVSWQRSLGLSWEMQNLGWEVREHADPHLMVNGTHVKGYTQPQC